MGSSVNIISIHSHKGGTGKTTMAIGLAALLAEPEPDAVVYLMDVDVTGASMGYVFPDLRKAKNSLGEYLTQSPIPSERVHLDDLEWDIEIPRKVGENSNITFHCVSCSADFTLVRNTMSFVYKTEYTELVAFQFNRLIEEVKKKHRGTSNIYIIIDNNPGLAEASVETMRIAEENSGVILFVASPDRADLLGLLEQSNELTQDFKKAKVIKVINRVEEAALSGIGKMDISEKRSIALDQIISNLTATVIEEDLESTRDLGFTPEMVFFCQEKMEYQFYPGQSGPCLSYFKDLGLGNLLEKMKGHFENDDKN